MFYILTFWRSTVGNYAYMIKFEGEVPNFEFNDGYVCGVVKCKKSYTRTSTKEDDFDFDPIEFKKGEKYLLTYMHTGDDVEMFIEAGFDPLPCCMKEEDYNNYFEAL